MNNLNKLTNLVYQAALDGNWRPFLQNFMQVTQSNDGWLIISDTQSLQPYFSEFISLNDDFDHQRFLNDYLPRIAEDPFYQHSVDLPESACFLGSDIVPREQLPSYSLYPLFESAGCEHMLAAIPVRDSRLNSFTVMNRHKGMDNYSSDDLRLTQLMVPHINRAFHLYSLLLRQQQQISLYQAMLEQNPNPLLLLNEHLQLSLTNQAAEQALSRQNLLLERNGRLIGKSAAHTQAIQDFVRMTIDWMQAKTPEPISIMLSSGEEKISLKAFPIHAESQFNNFADKLCVIEIVLDKQPNWTLISEHFKLTPKELRTVKCLYSGMDLRSIAEQSHLSYNTVKSQLMSVYNKNELSSQRELVAKLASYIQ